MTARLAAAALLLAGCASGKRGPDVRPGEEVLLLETRLKAQTVDIILSDRWRAEAALEALDVREESEGVLIARGGATFVLEGLRVEAAERIKVSYLPDHDDLVVHARDVELFRQKRPYATTKSDAKFLQRADRVAVVSIINSEPIIWPY